MEIWPLKPMSAIEILLQLNHIEWKTCSVSNFIGNGDLSNNILRQNGVFK